MSLSKLPFTCFQKTPDETTTQGTPKEKAKAMTDHSHTQAGLSFACPASSSLRFESRNCFSQGLHSTGVPGIVTGHLNAPKLGARQELTMFFTSSGLREGSCSSS